AGILIERENELFSKEGDRLSRFGFHNLGRHSLASFLMDEQANPAVVQAIMRHSQMDMTLYYAHSSKKQKRAALDNYAQHIVPARLICGGPGRYRVHTASRTLQVTPSPLQ